MDGPGRQQGLYFVFADGFDDNADICAFKRSSEVFVATKRLHILLGFDIAAETA